MKEIKYQEFPPPKKLEKVITCFWQFDYFNESGENLDHTILPDGCSSIVWIKNDFIPFQTIMFFGPQTRYYQVPVPPNTQYLGIRFQPHYFSQVTGINPLDIRGKSVPFSQMASNKLAIQELFDLSFSKESLAQFCEEKIPKDLEPDERIAKAIAHIQAKKGNLKTGEIAQAIFLSERQLQRLFKASTGYSPKEYCQIIRFRIALIELFFQQQAYQDVIFENGYFDQSHLFKDFYKLLEQSPEKFKAYISQIEHLLLTSQEKDI